MSPYTTTSTSSSSSSFSYSSSSPCSSFVLLPFPLFLVSSVPVPLYYSPSLSSYPFLVLRYSSSSLSSPLFAHFIPFTHHSLPSRCSPFVPLSSLPSVPRHYRPTPGYFASTGQHSLLSPCDIDIQSPILSPASPCLSLYINVSLNQMQ